MAQQGITIQVPVSLYYDPAVTTEEGAIDQFFDQVNNLGDELRAAHAKGFPFRGLCDIAFSGQHHDAEPFTPSDQQSCQERP